MHPTRHGSTENPFWGQRAQLVDLPGQTHVSDLPYIPALLPIKRREKACVLKTHLAGTVGNDVLLNSRQRLETEHAGERIPQLVDRRGHHFVLGLRLQDERDERRELKALVLSPRLV
jgi:hypothetical protein